MRPHMLVWWILFFLLVASSGAKSVTKARPHRVTPCGCRYKDILYDLSKLARGDGKPRFTIASAEEEEDSFYSYNPCIPFSITSNISTIYDCHNVAMCYWSKNGQRRDPLGYQHPGQISCRVSRDEHVSLVYLQGGQGRLLNYTTTIEMVCDRSKKCPYEATMKMISGKQSAIPTFQVFHQCCCPEGCSLTCSDLEPSYMLYIEIGAGVGGGVLLIISFIVGFFIAKKKYHDRHNENGPRPDQERPVEGGGERGAGGFDIAGGRRREGGNGGVDIVNNRQRQIRGGSDSIIAVRGSVSPDSISYSSAQSGSIPREHDENLTSRRSSSPEDTLTTNGARS